MLNGSRRNIAAAAYAQRRPIARPCRCPEARWANQPLYVSGLGFRAMADPRAEATDKLGGDYEARVLEPSPPAVSEPPYADDPVEPGEVPEGRELVSPVHNRG